MALSKANVVVLKATLPHMPIDNEEGQKSFKELMCYFLVEQVLLDARDVINFGANIGLWFQMLS
ncbi:hypothetical protein Hanom_Chr01g00018451 [Helianthus anomalus]